ncbi:Mobile element protein [Phaeobacter gallaeciensis]|uniref:Mobile element protein n=1 Tax=Phaeobacter gallaeciensis TaxID=60890 RepID=A0A1B0ZTV0_9RHOB|nr:Mobile element protein [Phaeobacter gallaeciensis]
MDWTVPDFSTLCRRQRTLNVSIPYRGGKGPLNLLIPSQALLAILILPH